MTHHGERTQRDLFAVASTSESLPPQTRQTLLLLLEKLLLEATICEMPAREGDDEQDHA